jgi:light-regulated signal transduction histidine kinase (bacteriophytochrome)
VRRFAAVKEASEHRHYARELEMANANLLRANRELEELTYVASHDFREPLRMINIYTELLMQECGQKLSQEASEFAGYIHYSVERMEHLIQDVLQYSQAIHDGRQQQLGPVPVRRPLDSAIGIFRASLDSAAAEIEIGDLPVVLAEESQLSLVFQNLLSNSLKYAHPERTSRIRIWSTESPDFQTIHFADNGIGFEPEFSERIFGLFKRLHGREVPGTGLGLAICRRIIEAHGGQIRAEGESQQGATFIFSLKGLGDHGPGYADIAGRGQSG